MVVLDEAAEDVVPEGLPDVERVEVDVVAACFPKVWPCITQYRCLSSTCSARSRKYGIQPTSPSDSAIFRFGKRWNIPLNSHESIVPEVRTPPR